MQPKVLGPREVPSQARQAGTAPLPGLLRTEGLMHSLESECFKVLDESPTLSKILPAILGTSIPPQLSLFLPTLDSRTLSEEKGWQDHSLGRTGRQVN